MPFDLQHVTDSNLLRKYREEGSEDAFAVLVHRHLSLVYGTAVRQIRDSALAQEIAQNTFILMAQRAVELIKHPTLSGWLYRTTIHLSRNAIRAEYRRTIRERVAFELGTTMKTEPSILSELAPVLDEALMDMDVNQRDILLLRFFQQKSIHEVGEVLKIREDAAQKRIAAALGSLIRQLRRRRVRVGSTALLFAALQQISSPAMPATLASTIIKAGVAAGSALAPSGSIATVAVKLMTLKQVQTTAICVALAVLPLGYEHYALKQSKADGERLNARLDRLRTAIGKEEEQGRGFGEQIASSEGRLQLFETATAQPVSVRSEPPPDLFHWDDSSPFVRLPLSILPKLKFGDFEERTRRDGKKEVVQMLPLDIKGTPKPVLLAALGLSDREASALTQITEKIFHEIGELATAHSTLERKPWPEQNPIHEAVVRKTTAFADQGTPLREMYRSKLDDLLGTERAEAFWQQAEPAFNEMLNDFGANDRRLQLILMDTGIDVFDIRKSGGTVSPLVSRRAPLPPILQASVDQWNKNHLSP